MEKQTVHNILVEVIDEMCDKYCKFPEQYRGDDELYEKHCGGCPLNRLI